MHTTSKRWIKELLQTRFKIYHKSFKIRPESKSERDLKPGRIPGRGKIDLDFDFGSLSDAMWGPEMDTEGHYFWTLFGMAFGNDFSWVWDAFWPYFGTPKRSSNGRKRKSLVFHMKNMIFEVSGRFLGFQKTCKYTLSNKPRIRMKFWTIFAICWDLFGI